MLAMAEGSVRAPTRMSSASSVPWLQPRDAVILFVQSDAPAFLTDLARLVHSRGCYLILISPLAKMSLSVLADITLLCGGFGGAGTAVSAQAFLIELIYRLYLQRLENARRALM